MICAKCKTLIRPRPSVCEVCQPPVPPVEGEPDRAEVLEWMADQLTCATCAGTGEMTVEIPRAEGGIEVYDTELEECAQCDGKPWIGTMDDQGFVEVTVGDFRYTLKLDRVEKI